MYLSVLSFLPALIAVSHLSARNITESSVTLFWTPPIVQYNTYHITFTSQVINTCLDWYKLASQSHYLYITQMSFLGCLEVVKIVHEQKRCEHTEYSNLSSHSFNDAILLPLFSISVYANINGDISKIHIQRVSFTVALEEPIVSFLDSLTLSSQHWLAFFWFTTNHFLSPIFIQETTNVNHMQRTAPVSVI